MMKERVFKVDTYTVINRTILTDQDRKNLIMLYQPIIGATATSLYFVLWSYLDKTELMSIEWTHSHLMTSMHNSLEEIIEAREKLEAIGLLKTYIKKADVSNFIYELYSPLNANEFFNNPVLSITLYNNVGSSEYEKIKNFFVIPKINLTSYEDITCHFNEVFEVADINNFETLLEDVRYARKNKLNLTSKINIDELFKLIPEELLNIRKVTNKQKELIYNLSFIYDLDNDKMSDLIMQALTDERSIDIDKLKERCRTYYSFEHSGKLPSLAYKNQPEYLRQSNDENSKKNKMIYQFETTSPHDYLLNKTNAEKLTKHETEILSYLLIDMNLKPGVVNVIIDYVLKISNNKLVKSFVEMIASQFAISKVETVVDAMKLASNETFIKEEHKVKKNNKKEMKPDWFDKKIETKEATKEELEEMEKLLSKYS